MSGSIRPGVTVDSDSPARRRISVNGDAGADAAAHALPASIERSSPSAIVLDSGIVIMRRTSATHPKVMHKGVGHLLGLCSLVVAALLRPGPVVRWLSRRFPDVLFQQKNAGPLVALTFDDSPTSGPAFACWNRTSGNLRLSQRTTGPGRNRAATTTEIRPRRCVTPFSMTLCAGC